MRLQVERIAEGVRLVGDGADVVLANRFLEHLSIRNFAAATRRAYAYDLLNFLRFCAERALPLAAVSAMDLFDYLDWQSAPQRGKPGRVVVPLRERRGAAAAGVARSGRGRGVCGRSRYGPGPGDGVGDAAGWAARR